MENEGRSKVQVMQACLRFRVSWQGHHDGRKWEEKEENNDTGKRVAGRRDHTG